MSGGIDESRYRACFMVGGKPEAIKLCESVLKALAVDGGYIHTGEPGSGHFPNIMLWAI